MKHFQLYVIPIDDELLDREITMIMMHGRKAIRRERRGIVKEIYSLLFFPPSLHFPSSLDGSFSWHVNIRLIAKLNIGRTPKRTKIAIAIQPQSLPSHPKFPT